jgi:carboxypeptidase C (cathepsin A)
LTQNPALRVHVCNGYYDLATPYMATKYTFSHLELDPTLAGHVSMSFYEAGHMMYIHGPSLAKQRRELAGFIRAAAATEGR